MHLNGDTVSSEQLGHLGLIASVIRDLGIIEKIDERLPLDPKKGGIVTHGQRAAAMMLNGLGFMNSRLYMTQHFFQDKPVGQLLDSNIDSSHLNDDSLGRCLDKIAEYGVTQLFSEIAFEVASEKQVLGHRLHLDSTSFVLHGRYDTNNSNGPEPTYGYSKAHRPDLKQVMLSLTQGGAANLPLWMEPQDGNTSDTKSFHETVRRVKGFMSKLQDAPDDLCFVVDAAFYDAKKLAELDKVRWITRVPAKLKDAKDYLQAPSETFNWKKLGNGYQCTSKEITIEGLKQRWILIFSQAAYEREQATLNRRLDKEYTELSKSLWHLGNQVFSCASDAEVALKDLIKKKKYHQVEYTIEPVWKYRCKGRPSKTTPCDVVGYCVKSFIATDLSCLQQYQDKLGRFILGTNQLDSNELTDNDVLTQYKEQSQVEAGFKFIKNDSFELDSFYLNTPARIGALMMIMTLCLMVYNFAQYKLRICLDENNDIVPNQHGKPTKKPTIRWIAEMMVVIAVVTIKHDDNKTRIVTNLNQVHKNIIAYFGRHALKMYGLPDDYKPIEINYQKFKNFLHWCET